MAKSNKNHEKLEQIVMEKVIGLEAENANLRQQLALVNAKLSVYERIATISDNKNSIGFGPPIYKEDA